MSTHTDTLPAGDDPVQLLREASLLLASFRGLNRRAGYPFREPPNVDAMLARIDAVCFPEIRNKPGRKPRVLPQPVDGVKLSVTSDLRVVISNGR